MSGEIMLINPKKRKRRTTKRRRRRTYRRNPVPGASLALNPQSRRRRRATPSGIVGIAMDVLPVAGGAVAGLMVPEKVFKVTGNTKYAVQAGGAMLSLMSGKFIGRSLARKIATGFVLAGVLTAINDHLLKPKGQSILGQEEATEIPEIEQDDVYEIPEIPGMGDIEPIDEISQGEEIVLMPEAYELEQDEFEQGENGSGLDDLEPVEELEMEAPGV